MARCPSGQVWQNGRCQSVGYGGAGPKPDVVGGWIVPPTGPIQAVTGFDPLTRLPIEAYKVIVAFMAWEQQLDKRARAKALANLKKAIKAAKKYNKAFSLIETINYYRAVSQLPPVETLPFELQGLGAFDLSPSGQLIPYVPNLLLYGIAAYFIYKALKKR